LRHFAFIRSIAYVPASDHERVIRAMNAPQNTIMPYHVEGADRPSRWVITCDHASNRVPPDVGGGDLGLPPEDMERHIAYDVGAAGVARALAEALDAPVILSDFSRLVIDPNRGEDDPTLLMKVYDGSIIPGQPPCRRGGGGAPPCALSPPLPPRDRGSDRVAPGPVVVAVHSFTPQFVGPCAPAMACGGALCRGHAPCPAASWRA
jgi:predicted N-formylglutamate amidohydrolase